MPHSASTRVARRRRLFVPVAIVVVLAAGWTGFWFYAAARAEADLAAWRERARQAGRPEVLHADGEAGVQEREARLDELLLLERVAHLLSGGHVCAYEVSPFSRRIPKKPSPTS